MLRTNEAMARRYWPNQDAMGRHLGVTGPVRPAVRESLWQHYMVGGGGSLQSLVVRANGDAGPVVPELEGIIRGVLTLVAMIACYLPARRTMRIDPMRALRHE